MYNTFQKNNFSNLILQVKIISFCLGPLQILLILIKTALETNKN